jgi:cellulose synthase/poly-beta-1,6-N-acetylglucosamine synthase-like glycosyltransferase
VRSGELTLTLYGLASIAFLVDLVDLLIRLYLRRQYTIQGKGSVMPATSVVLNVANATAEEVQFQLRPYALVVSVHNLTDELEPFLESLRAFIEHVWVIDDGSSDDTAVRIETAGFRCIRGVTNQFKPGALKMLMAMLPSDIQTVVVLDPDARILTTAEEFHAILFEFQRSRMAALCPRIGAAGCSWLARIQRLEYWMAFSIGRKSLADFSITSGVAVYRADALRRLLEKHTLSVYAEDLENTLILLSQGESIYYDGRLVVETDAVSGSRRLFSQRVGWHYGLIRVYAQRWRTLRRRAREHFGFAYQFLVYIGGFVFLLHPLKLIGLALIGMSAANDVDNILGLHWIPDGRFTDPMYFPTVYVEYLALILFASMVAVGRSERRMALMVVPLYPLYAIAHVVPATIGYLNWFTLRLWGRRVYRDHYQPATP